MILLLPWMVVLSVLVIDVLLIRSVLRTSQKDQTPKLTAIKSYFLGSFFVLMIAALVNLVLCEAFLSGEQGAFSLLFSVIGLVSVFLLTNVGFLLGMLFLRRPEPVTGDPESRTPAAREP